MKNKEGQLMKLGKRPVFVPRVKDKRILQLRHYLKKGAVEALVQRPVPDEASWITKLAAAEAFPMYLNDVLGCCVEAAAAHMVQQWTWYAGSPVLLTDADVLKAYEDVGGYVPGDPSTDQGTDMVAFLNYWKTTGIGGHTIVDYLAVDWKNEDELRLAIILFGNLFTGIALPVSAQGENAWTVTDGGIYAPAGEPGSWGGHCIPLMAQSLITATCVTWGTSLKMSLNFQQDYVDEMFVCLSTDWLNTNGLSPEHMDLDQLEKDIRSRGVDWNAPVPGSSASQR